MCRFFNTENNTVFFDGKFAGTEVFKSLGKSLTHQLFLMKLMENLWELTGHFRYLSPEACGDLIAAVFDFAHGMCALKLTEQQLALFSALVLINAGKSKKK